MYAVGLDVNHLCGGVLVGALVLGLAAGCAGKGERRSVSPADAAVTPAPAAKASRSSRSGGQGISAAAVRIYMLGEERFAEARFAEAVALWGHAMLQLPSDPSTDAVRHKLFARMGHGLLQAYGATDEASYLRDGQQMCTLYLAQHEALFGDTKKAREERGQVYELLHEFESRLEALPPESEEPVAAASAAAVPASAVPAPAASSKATVEDETASEAASEVVEDGNIEGDLHRFIRVRRVEWARFEDPRVMEFLRDSRDTGPSLLDWGGEQVHGPRVLVRAGAFPRALAEEVDASTRQTARRVGFEVIAVARPALRHCYELAMTRDPVMAARVDVQLTVEPDGTVRQPRLVGGSLIDAEGDVCMAQALRDVTLPTPSHGEALAITMPIQFFHQDALYASQLDGSPRPTIHRGYEGTGTRGDLPTIERFNHPPIGSPGGSLKRRGN